MFAGTTVSVVLLAIVGFFVEVAVIVVSPTSMAVARPDEEPMLATVVDLLLDHVTGVLLVLPSSKVPTAVNC